MTQRSSAATTMQMIELASGEEFSQFLNQLSQKMIERIGIRKNAHQIIKTVFNELLSREPTKQELQAARLLLEEKKQTDTISNDRVSDLIWSTAMLPEFQLIH